MMKARRLWPALTSLMTAAVALSACVTAPPPSNPQPVRLFDVAKQGRDLYAMREEFAYCDRQTGRVIVVPRWFETDFASVPWYGQFAIRPDGPSARAAIVHDWLYAVGERGKRQEADDIFLRAMERYGVGQFERLAAYNAVRLGGEGGYGLASDWKFVDPNQPGVYQPAPLSKPKTATVRIMPGCKGFDALLQTGWKAYPRSRYRVR